MLKWLNSTDDLKMFYVFMNKLFCVNIFSNNLS